MASQPRRPSLKPERLTGMSRRLIIEQQANNISGAYVW
jgi:hypothetical protein